MSNEKEVNNTSRRIRKVL